MASPVRSNGTMSGRLAVPAAQRQRPRIAAAAHPLDLRRAPGFMALAQSGRECRRERVVAGRPGRAHLGHGRLIDANDASAAERPRGAEGIRVRAEVEGADERIALVERPCPVDVPGRRGPAAAAEVARAVEAKRARGQGVAAEIVDETAEAAAPGLEALGVEGERGLIGIDGEAFLFEDVAGVDLRHGHVPGDAVLGLLVHQRPGGGVQASIRRQQRVVEVDRHPPGQRQPVVAEHAQVADAEQVVGGAGPETAGQAVVVRLARQVQPPRPGLDRRVFGDDERHARPGRAELFAARHQQ